MSTAMVAERMESTKEMNGEPINFSMFWHAQVLSHDDCRK